MGSLKMTLFKLARAALLGSLLLASAAGVFAQSVMSTGNVASLNNLKNAAYCADTSVAANTITCSTAVGFTGYAAGQAVDVLLANTATGATVININTLGNKAVTYNGTNALTSALGLVAGSTMRLQYDGTRFVLQGLVAAGPCPAGSNTQVQYNNSGVCGGNSGFTFDPATGAVAIGAISAAQARVHIDASSLAGPALWTRGSALIVQSSLNTDVNTMIDQLGSYYSRVQLGVCGQFRATIASDGTISITNYGCLGTLDEEWPNAIESRSDVFNSILSSSDGQVGSSVFTGLDSTQHMIARIEATESVLASESLTNPNLTGGTDWTRTGDFALTGNAATYTHSAGSGTFQQASGTLAIASIPNRWYTFGYTVSGRTGGTPACVITTAFAKTFDVTFTLKVAAGTYTRQVQANSAPGNFVISCTSSVATTITYDTLSLKENLGGEMSLGGSLASYNLIAANKGGVNAPSHTFSKYPGSGMFVEETFTNGGVFVAANGGNTVFGASYDSFRVASDVPLGWSSINTAIASLDTALYRNAAGVVEINNGTPGTFRDLKLRSLIGVGTAPSVGTCGTIGTGSTNIAGFITSATGACVPVLTFVGTTAPTGWSCSIQNSTTPANIFQQTGSSTTTATFTGVSAANDILRYACLAY